MTFGYLSCIILQYAIKKEFEMKLYYTPGACSLVVRIVLHEIGIDCEYESVDLKAKRTETGENYLEINPKGSVPALRLDNDEVLTENAVILQYLADKYNAIELLPAVNTLRRYRVLEWLNMASSDLHKNAGAAFNSKIPEETKEKVFKANVKRQLKIIDDHLYNHDFLMGDSMTLGDVYVFVILTWLPLLKISMNEYPNLFRYFSEMKQIKSVAQALKEEGLSEITS